MAGTDFHDRPPVCGAHDAGHDGEPGGSGGLHDAAGLAPYFAWGHHYGPEPWCEVPGARADWLPSYYHQADKEGLGFDRSRTGSDAVSQYPDSLARVFDSLEQCPEEYLLWFHHVNWNQKLRSGRSLWDELCYKYQKGVDEVRAFQRIWKDMQPYVDAERYQAVAERLDIQARDAVWWKDACLEYFRTFSKRNILKEWNLRYLP